MDGISLDSLELREVSGGEEKSSGKETRLYRLKKRNLKAITSLFK